MNEVFFFCVYIFLYIHTYVEIRVLNVCNMFSNKCEIIVWLEIIILRSP